MLVKIFTSATFYLNQFHNRIILHKTQTIVNELIGKVRI